MAARLKIPDYLLASFNSVHDAMKAENLCKEADLKARLVPTPESVKAGCGLSLRVQPDLAGQLADLLDQESVNVTHWTLSTTINDIRQFIPQNPSLWKKDGAE